MPAIMSRPTPMAGGFFLIVPIVAGFLWGLGSGRAMQGAIIGLGVGFVLALIVWLVDRARRRP
jgi:membrane associated rhomboid family serine protease